MVSERDSTIYKLGVDGAIAMARSGRLRLSPFFDHEKTKYPYTIQLKPVRATILIWRTWWKERG